MAEIVRVEPEMREEEEAARVGAVETVETAETEEKVIKMEEKVMKEEMVIAPIVRKMVGTVIAG